MPGRVYSRFLWCACWVFLFVFFCYFSVFKPFLLIVAYLIGKFLPSLFQKCMIYPLYAVYLYNPVSLFNYVFSIQSD